MFKQRKRKTVKNYNEIENLIMLLSEASRSVDSETLVGVSGEFNGC